MIDSRIIVVDIVKRLFSRKFEIQTNMQWGEVKMFNHVSNYKWMHLPSNLFERRPLCFLLKKFKELHDSSKDFSLGGSCLSVATVFSVSWYIILELALLLLSLGEGVMIGSTSSAQGSDSWGMLKKLVLSSLGVVEVGVVEVGVVEVDTALRP